MNNRIKELLLKITTNTVLILALVFINVLSAKADAPLNVFSYHSVTEPNSVDDSSKHNSRKSATKVVSQEELNWALDLEQKVMEGHNPTEQEKAKYQDIAEGIQAGSANSDRKPRNTDASRKSSKVVSQEELKWALDLEQKVKDKGYNPTPKETATYEDIAKRLSTQERP